ncbi:hypothetical protein BDW71DRAFT_167292 [Aspergillus fruticulosus]
MQVAASHLAPGTVALRLPTYLFIRHPPSQWTRMFLSERISTELDDTSSIPLLPVSRFAVTLQVSPPLPALITNQSGGCNFHSGKSAIATEKNKSQVYTVIRPLRVRAERLTGVQSPVLRTSPEHPASPLFSPLGPDCLIRTVTVAVFLESLLAWSTEDGVFSPRSSRYRCLRKHIKEPSPVFRATVSHLQLRLCPPRPTPPSHHRIELDVILGSLSR